MQKLKSKEKTLIEPLNTYLAVEIEPEKTQTKSGLSLPDTAKAKPNHGKVVAISEEIKNKNIKIGDIIYFPAYLFTETRIEGKDLAMIKYEDIACKITK